MIKTLCSFVLIMILAATTTIIAQDAPQVRLSPVAIAQTTVNDTYIKVVYGQPHKRGREVFGELVPYGEVWRTGANESTEITFTGDVEIGGETIEAGTYSVFTIPGEDSWTFILNSGLGQWGTRYNEDLNVFSTTIQSGNTEETWEAFTIRLERDNGMANLVMIWDQTRVVVPITVK
jgi:hypothetical protein